MICERCGGRKFLDRIFSDNLNFETACLMCGDRQYVAKNSVFGAYLDKMEKALRRQLALPL